MELAGAIISALVVIFAAWLKWKTGKGGTYADLQTGRQDIESGDADAVSQRIDRLLVESDGDTSAVSGGGVTEERLRAVCGVANVELSNGDPVRESGKVQ